MNSSLITFLSSRSLAQNIAYAAAVMALLLAVGLLVESVRRPHLNNPQSGSTTGQSAGSTGEQPGFNDSSDLGGSPSNNDAIMGASNGTQFNPPAVVRARNDDTNYTFGAVYELNGPASATKEPLVQTPVISGGGGGGISSAPGTGGQGSGKASMTGAGEVHARSATSFIAAAAVPDAGGSSAILFGFALAVIGSGRFFIGRRPRTHLR